MTVIEFLLYSSIIFGCLCYIIYVIDFLKEMNDFYYDCLKDKHYLSKTDYIFKKYFYYGIFERRKIYKGFFFRLLSIILPLVPIFNIIYLLGIMVIIFDTENNISNKKRVQNFFNQPCKCSKCGIVTRLAYLCKFNKENKLDKEENNCPLCKEKNTMFKTNEGVNNRIYPEVKFKELKNYLVPVFIESQSYFKVRKEFREVAMMERQQEEKRDRERVLREQRNRSQHFNEQNITKIERKSNRRSKFFEKNLVLPA